MPNINQTPRFGLNQWEGEDPVRRTDFNADNQVLEAALSFHADRLEALDEQVETGAYHTYQLMLQNYYDQKYTGYKQGMAFDGFTDGSMVAGQVPGCRIDTAGKRAHVLKASAANVTASFLAALGTNSGSSQTMHIITTGTNRTVPLVPAGWGYLESMTLRMNSSSGTNTAQITLLDGTHEVWTSGDLAVSTGGMKDYTITPHGSLLLQGLHPYTVRVSSQGSNLWVSAIASGSMGVSYAVTPMICDTGALESVPFPMERDWSTALLWLRHNGAVTARLKLAEDAIYDMQATKTGATMTLQGMACSESSYHFKRPVQVGGGAPALVLEMDAREGDCEIYDYGLVFLP